MGSLIDRAALTALCAAGLYLFYLNAGFGIPVSAALTFACMALGRYVVRRRPGRERVSGERARAALMRIAMLPEDEAEAALKRLTGEDAIVCALCHPDETLSAGKLFSLWREHLGEPRVAIVATCAAQPEAKALCDTLTNPQCALFDRKALEKAIRVTGLYATEAPSEPLWRRLRRALARLDRPLGLRVALYGLSLLAMYWLTGRTLCLFSGLLLIGATGLTRIRSRASR